MKRINRDHNVRKFHQARWDEDIIFELSSPGERGILIPEASEGIKAVSGDGISAVPESMRRKVKPALPEISQPRVLRHYTRLSQETLGADVNIEIGQGTCTVKYSPKVNEALSRMPEVTELHPLQPVETVQGMLQIFHELDLYLREVSGMEQFTFQPSGGSQAIMTMAAVTRAYHNARGEGDTRKEIITTIYSHPSDAAAAAVLGFDIIYIQPDENGHPDYEGFKAAVSDKTAAFFVANPEDTGLYNPKVLEFTKLVRDHGGLCGYDQANANGLLGITRAKEAGFDMCFFNLHKTFSTPHGTGGPATGAMGVVEKLIKYLPGPLIEKGETGYFLDDQFGCETHNVGKVRSYNGVAPVVLKAYAWIRSLGAEGLYEVAKIASLNNNYLFKKLLEIEDISVPYKREHQRIEQVRYTLESLTEKTGITSGEIQRRMMDFGMHYWTSHHPYYIPEPITLEPTETPSKEDIDEYVHAIKQVVREAYESPEIIKTAPHASVIHQVDESEMDDPAKWAITWRSYLKKSEH